VTRCVDYRVVLMGWMHCTCRSTNTFRCIFWGREVMSRHVSQSFSVPRHVTRRVVYKRASTCLSPFLLSVDVCAGWHVVLSRGRVYFATAVFSGVEL